MVVIMLSRTLYRLVFDIITVILGDRVHLHPDGHESVALRLTEQFDVVTADVTTD